MPKPSYKKALMPVAFTVIEQVAKAAPDVTKNPAAVPVGRRLEINAGKRKLIVKHAAPKRRTGKSGG